MAAQLLELSGGGQLAWEETGAPDGIPLLFFHGWPASRLQGAGFDVEARELGIRIISTDRPGIGLSSFQPNRRLLDWPPLIAQLTEHLGIESFLVMAISGGGPYGLVTARAFPDRVLAGAIISGAPPLPPDADPAALFAVYRWMLALYRTNPDLIRLFFRAARPFATIRPPDWLWPWILRITPPADARTLRDKEIFESSFQSYCESWRWSGQGVAADGEIYAEPWGFEPSEITAQIRLWHGKEDSSFHWSLAEKLARELPRCEFLPVEGEGHYSLPIQNRRVILEDLLEAARSGGSAIPGKFSTKSA